MLASSWYKQSNQRVLKWFSTKPNCGVSHLSNLLRGGAAQPRSGLSDVQCVHLGEEDCRQRQGVGSRVNKASLLPDGGWWLAKFCPVSRNDPAGGPFTFSPINYHRPRSAVETTVLCSMGIGYARQISVSGATRVAYNSTQHAMTAWPIPAR